MFELTINGEVYQFKFGIGFVREINKTAQMPVDGVPGASQDVGLEMEILKVLNGDVIALCNMLDLANKGFSPRVTKKLIDDYIDDEDTDIDALFDMVIGFLGQANATRKATKKMMEALEMTTEKDQ